MTATDTIAFVLAAIILTITIYMVPALVIRFFRTPRNDRDFPDYFFTIMMPVCMIGACWVTAPAIF